MNNRNDDNFILDVSLVAARNSGFENIIDKYLSLNKIRSHRLGTYHVFQIQFEI